jgi:hypothetical protein
MPKITTQPTPTKNLSWVDSQNLEILEDWQINIQEHFQEYPEVKNKYLAMDFEEFSKELSTYAERLSKMLMAWYSEAKKVPHKHFMVNNNLNLLK